MDRQNRYTLLIESIFKSKYAKGITDIPFDRVEIMESAKKLKIELPKNLGDIIYSFRYRTSFPKSIAKTAPKGYMWIIRPAGRSKYSFSLVKATKIAPNANLINIKIPDSTPGIVEKYAFSDEQALLAKVRYNRLIDIFTGITCYSLQNHLRTTVPDMGQVETDELYAGLDQNGIHYAFPVQAKGHKDNLSMVQIEQDIGVCKHKLPGLICCPLGAQFMANDVISLFEFKQERGELKIVNEKHYQLVPPDDMTEEELEKYKDCYKRNSMRT